MNTKTSNYSSYYSVIITLVFSIVFLNLTYSKSEKILSNNKINTFRYFSIDTIDFELLSTGPLKRRRERCGINPSTLAGSGQNEIVFNLCIDRTGNIIYISYNTEISKAKDPNFIKEAMAVQKSCKYVADSTAPAMECGTVTFRVGANIQRLN